MRKPLTQREKKALNALNNNPVMRENLDTIAGCSNSPELVAGLRRKGLIIALKKVINTTKAIEGYKPAPAEVIQKVQQLRQQYGVQVSPGK